MGKARDRFDGDGNEKVQCRLCNLWYHRVDVHIEQKHPGITLVAYKAAHPGVETMSATAIESLRAAGELAHAEAEETPFRFGVASLFPRFGLDDYDAKFVPQHDEKWEDTPEVREHLECLAIAMQDDDNALIVGPPGVGKTTLARELAAICGQPLRRLPFNGDMRLIDFVGGDRLATNSKTKTTVTVFRKGPLVDAAERGHWLLFDEFDSGPPPVTFVLHSFMENPRQLTLMGSGSGVSVNINPNTRVIATANTIGYGDDSGLLAGTGPMNEALLDRFGIVIKMGYPHPAEEVKILVAKTGIGNAAATKMVELANKVREAQSNNVTLASVSPRRLIMWATKAVRFNDVTKASVVTLINRVPAADAKFIRSLGQRIFGSGTVRPI